MIIRFNPSPSIPFSSPSPSLLSPLFVLLLIPSSWIFKLSNPVTNILQMPLPLNPFLCFYFLTVPYMYPLLLFHFLFLHCNFSLSLVPFPPSRLQFFPFSYSIFSFFTHHFHFPLFRFHFPFTPLPFPHFPESICTSSALIFPLFWVTFSSSPPPFFPTFAQVQYLPLHCSP